MYHLVFVASSSKGKTEVYLYNMKIATSIYFGITVLLFTDFIAYLFYGISLSGNLPDRILFWVWFVFTFFIVFKNFKKKWGKFYGAFLGFLVILTLAPMMIPFFQIIVFALNKEERIEVEGVFSLAETDATLMSLPVITLCKSKFIIEERIGKIDYEIKADEGYYRLQEAKEIKLISEEPNGDVLIEFEFEGGKAVRRFTKN